MSSTASVGVYTASYWSFMAKIMARRLDQALAQNRIESEAFPKGVFQDSLKFFNLVLGAIGDSETPNPPASINAYAIASEAVRGSSNPFPVTLERLKDVLSEYAKFNESLMLSRSLEGEERETALVLSKFFAQLARDGENERYEEIFGLEAPSAALRWR